MSFGIGFRGVKVEQGYGPNLGSIDGSWVPGPGWRIEGGIAIHDGSTGNAFKTILTNAGFRYLVEIVCSEHDGTAETHFALTGGSSHFSKPIKAPGEYSEELIAGKDNANILLTGDASWTVSAVRVRKVLK